MAVRVKICGITNLDDALVAIEAGADALGFIFFKGSPRFIRPAAAAEIVRKLPPFVSTVGVFVDAAVESVSEVLRQTEISVAQLHGNESPEFCAQIQGPVAKAFRVKDQSSLAALPNYRVSAFLLDSYVAGQPGGTGAKFNWDLAQQAKSIGTPIILAGGLTVDNVADAIAKVCPYGVDVSSGVETAPGQKDHGRVRDFIARAKRA